MATSLPQLVFDEARLRDLRRTGLTETDRVENFDRFVRLAVDATDAGGGYVSLISDERQYLRGCAGLPEPLSSRRETPLEESICAHVLDRTEPVAIEDLTASELFEDHPAVSAYGIESYLGVPLIGDAGRPLGTFCVVDWEPRAWTDDQVARARDLAAGVRSEILLRRELRRREALEEELASREATLRAIVANVTDIITIADADGTVVFQSPSLEEVLGYEPEELVGETFWDYVHPEDREPVARKMEWALENPGEVVAEEFRFRHADGTWRTLESRGRRLPRESELGTVIAVGRDVTERRALEERLRILATAVESVDAGVLITGPRLDPPGPEIRYANEAVTRMTGYSEEELVGSTPRILQGPETERETLDRLKRQLARGEPFEGQTVNYRKDGTPYHLRWKVTPLRDPEGEVAYYVSVQEDVTDRVRREEILEQRVRERTRELDQSQSEALNRLARAAEYRDDETGKHTQRVGAVAALLARALGRDEAWVGRIREAAPLHDVGKIGIPDDILLKPGALTDDEFRVMKRHTEIGADLLGGGRSELMQMAEEIARSHHERWGGGGYPDGLSGEDISPAARIVAVADALDAMTHDRPYRDALAADAAFREVEGESGTQFAPRVAEALLDRREEVLQLLERPGSP